MRLFVAPETIEPVQHPGVFLAGGITGCPNWQDIAVLRLRDFKGVLYNPRRPAFDVSVWREAPTQIEWEHKALRAADAILFWFPAESVQPIALYELGAWSMTDKPLFVGVHPRYPRRLDVEVQTRLVRPDIEVRLELDVVLADVVRWAATL